MQMVDGGRMKSIVIVGSGGAARETEWLIEDINNEKPTWNFLGFIDRHIDLGDNIVGDDSFFDKIDKEIYVVCAIANPKIRKKVINNISKNANVNFATLIHPSTKISKKCVIGEGSIIFANNIISVNAIIGKHVFINFGSFIGHDSVVGSFTTINTNSKISGNVRIGEGTLIGVGSVILEKTEIGYNSIVGIGSVVSRDVPNDCVVLGYPSRIVASNRD